MKAMHLIRKPAARALALVFGFLQVAPAQALETPAPRETPPLLRAMHADPDWAANRNLLSLLPRVDAGYAALSAKKQETRVLDLSGLIGPQTDTKALTLALGDALSPVYAERGWTLSDTALDGSTLYVHVTRPGGLTPVDEAAIVNAVWQAVVSVLPPAAESLEEEPRPGEGEIAAGFSPAEISELRRGVNAASSATVRAGNQAIVAEIERRAASLVDAPGKISGLRERLTAAGLSKRGAETVTTALQDPGKEFLWFRATVESADRYVLGLDKALAIDVAAFLLEEERRLGVADLLDEYILHEALERSPVTKKALDGRTKHRFIIDFTSAFFNRGAFEAPGETALGGALRRFINVAAEAHHRDLAASIAVVDAGLAAGYREDVLTEENLAGFAKLMRTALPGGRTFEQARAERLRARETRQQAIDAAVKSALIAALRDSLEGTDFVQARDETVIALEAAAPESLGDPLNALLAAIARQNAPLAASLRSLLSAAVDEAVAAELDFRDPGEAIAWLDGTSSRVAEIREGDWRGQGMPAWLRGNHVQLTGPVDSPGMVIGGANTGYQRMADAEDASSPLRKARLEAQRWMKRLLSRVGGQRAIDGEGGRRLQSEDRLAKELFRPPGLHLEDRNLRAGETTAGAFAEAWLFLANNARNLSERGLPVLLYLPKLESAEELDLWHMFLYNAEKQLGLRPGTARAFVLAEIDKLNFELEEAGYALSRPVYDPESEYADADGYVAADHMLGFNVGRWDEKASMHRTRRADPFAVPTDSNNSSMEADPGLAAYELYVSDLCLKRGWIPWGGMSNLILLRSAVRPGDFSGIAGANAPELMRELEQRGVIDAGGNVIGFQFDPANPDALPDVPYPDEIKAVIRLYAARAYSNQVALERVRMDKQREAGARPAADGLHRLFAGAWAATLDLVAVVQDVFAGAGTAEKLDRALALGYNPDNGPRDDWYTKALGDKLRAYHNGPVTEAGLREDVSIALQYFASYLNGGGAAAVESPQLGVMLMDDLATGEMRRRALWLRLRNWPSDAAIGGDGEFAGAALDAEVLRALVAQEAERLNAKGAPNREKFQLAADILLRAVLNEKQIPWISDALNSVIEIENPVAQQAALDAFFEAYNLAGARLSRPEMAGYFETIARVRPKAYREALFATADSLLARSITDEAAPEQFWKAYAIQALLAKVYLGELSQEEAAREIAGLLEVSPGQVAPALDMIPVQYNRNAPNLFGADFDAQVAEVEKQIRHLKDAYHIDLKLDWDLHSQFFEGVPLERQPKSLAEAVVMLRGVLNVESNNLARAGAEQFLDLVHAEDDSYVLGLGAYTGQAAAQIIRMRQRLKEEGFGRITTLPYNGGWNNAADMGEFPFTDQAINDITNILDAGETMNNHAVMLAADAGVQLKEGDPRSRDFKDFNPMIVTDIEAPPSPLHAFWTVVRGVKRGLGIYHAEHQQPGFKVCGHAGGACSRVIQEQIDVLQAMHFAGLVMGVPVAVIGRTDGTHEKFLNRRTERDQGFILGRATTADGRKVFRTSGGGAVTAGELNRGGNDTLVGTAVEDGKTLKGITFAEARARGLAADAISEDGTSGAWKADDEFIFDEAVALGYARAWDDAGVRAGAAGSWSPVKTQRGLFRIRPGVDRAIYNSKEMAPYVHMIWSDTHSLSKDERRVFAEGVREEFPHMLFADNRSPNLAWENMSDEELRTYTDDLVRWGYKFIFITLNQFIITTGDVYERGLDFAKGGHLALAQRLREMRAADPRLRQNQRAAGSGVAGVVQTAAGTDVPTFGGGATEAKYGLDKPAGSVPELWRWLRRNRDKLATMEMIGAPEEQGGLGRAAGTLEVDERHLRLHTGPTGLRHLSPEGFPLVIREAREEGAATYQINPRITDEQAAAIEAILDRYYVNADPQSSDNEAQAAEIRAVLESARDLRDWSYAERAEALGLGGNRQVLQGELAAQDALAASLDYTVSVDVVRQAANVAQPKAVVVHASVFSQAADGAIALERMQQQIRSVLADAGVEGSPGLLYVLAVEGETPELVELAKRALLDGVNAAKGAALGEEQFAKVVPANGAAAAIDAVLPGVQIAGVVGPQAWVEALDRSEGNVADAIKPVILNPAGGDQIASAGAAILMATEAAVAPGQPDPKLAEALRVEETGEAFLPEVAVLVPELGATIAEYRRRMTLAQTQA